MFRPRVPAVVNNVVTAASNAASSVANTVQDATGATHDAVTDAIDAPSVPASPAAITGAFGHFAEDARAVVHTGVERIGTRAGHIGGTVIDRGADVARGVIGGTAEVVRGGLGRIVPKVVDFAGDALGAGGIGGRVRDTVGAIRQPVDRGIDKVVGGVTNIGHRAGAFGGRVIGGARDAKNGVIGGLHDAKGAAVRATIGAVDDGRAKGQQAVATELETHAASAGEATNRGRETVRKGMDAARDAAPTMSDVAHVMTRNQQFDNAGSNLMQGAHDTAQSAIDNMKGTHGTDGRGGSEDTPLSAMVVDVLTNEIDSGGGDNAAEDIIDAATGAVDDAADAGRDAASDATDAGGDAADNAGEVFTNVTGGGGGGGGGWPF